MSTDGELVLVTALIRPHMEGHVVRVLHDLPDFAGFTFADVRGQGRGRGQGGAYVSSVTDLTYHHFLELRLVCKAELADDICNRIRCLDRPEGRRGSAHNAGPLVCTHPGNRPTSGEA